MYGQMTAGSWIYIGTQGILQGTYETLAELARRHFGGTPGGPAGRHRRPRRHGRRPAARRHDERRRRARRRGGSGAHRAAAGDRAISTSAPTSLDDALARVERASTRAARAIDRARGNAADVLPELVRRGVIAGRRHRSDLRARRAQRLRAQRPVARRGGGACAQRDPDEYIARVDRGDGDARRARCSRCSARGAVAFDYGNNIRAQAAKAGVADAFDIPGFVPEYIRPLFCEGKGPFRWVALSGDPADIAATDRARARDVRRRRGAVPLDPARRASASRSRDCRRGSSGSATASARDSGWRSTIWCGAAWSRRRS